MARIGQSLVGGDHCCERLVSLSVDCRVRHFRCNHGRSRLWDGFCVLPLGPAGAWLEYLFEPDFAQARFVEGPNRSSRASGASTHCSSEIGNESMNLAIVVGLAPRKLGSFERWVLALCKLARERGHHVDLY